MIDDLYIMYGTGVLVFSWHSKESKIKDDDLFSGFMSAINSFASVERGEDIKSLKLDPSTIIFERLKDPEIIFIITTTNDELIELLHSVLHDILNGFLKTYGEFLTANFDGEVSKFKNFSGNVEKILNNYGLDSLADLTKKIDDDGYLKSVSFLEPKGNNILYIKAKQHVNKEKISFLIPLLMSSSRLLYMNNLNENVRWILLSSSRNEIILVEPRDNILIIKQYDLPQKFDEKFLGLEFFKEKSKYIKKPKNLAKIFEEIHLDSRIKQLFLVDLFGKTIYSKILDNSFDCSDYIPEAISFLTSSKKASEEIYSRPLLNATIGGEKLSTVCVNFNNFALILIGSIMDFSDFNTIQEINSRIIDQLE